ncbi:MAG TPA: hypothetical protein VGI39_38985, partial [Polyangiaceae bacterium]
MSAPTISGVFQIGVDILNTILGTQTNPDNGQQTGTILAQTGDAVKQVTDCDNAEWWQHTGFASRPVNPKNGVAACQGVAIRCSNRDVVIASRDVRTNQIYGNLSPGETCVFAPGPDGKAQARTMWKADGSITHYTTSTNDDSGSASYERIHPSKGWMLVWPWGKLVFDQTGFHMTHQSGVSFDMGQTGGLPIPGLSSAIQFKAGLFKAEAGACFLGVGPAWSPVAWGFAEVPLTMPGVPIIAAGFGAPIGLFTSNSVRV